MLLEATRLMARLNHSSLALKEQDMALGIRSKQERRLS